MGLFTKTKEPVIVKDTSEAKIQIEALKALLHTASTELKVQINQDIKTLSAGIYGEDQIMFELKNSHMPLYILHDLYLKENDCSAQIDFLIITEKINFIIECKNMIGNIEINDRGDFIRTTSFDGKEKKEGIYSPITQNQRHIELIKQTRIQTKSNFLSRAMFEKGFYNVYQGIVVFANHKTVLNDQNALPAIKEQVIRVDQLIAHIKRVNEKSKLDASSDKMMEKLATFFMSKHQENKSNFMEKYKDTILPKHSESSKDHLARYIPEKYKGIEVERLEDTSIYKEIRHWRYDKSQQENIKPYHVFYNTTLDELVTKKPMTFEELKSIGGLGEHKCKKYGRDLLDIIARYA